MYTVPKLSLSDGKFGKEWVTRARGTLPFLHHARCSCTVAYAVRAGRKTALFSATLYLNYTNVQPEYISLNVRYSTTTFQTTLLGTLIRGKKKKKKVEVMGVFLVGREAGRQASSSSALNPCVAFSFYLDLFLT